MAASKPTSRRSVLLQGKTWRIATLGARGSILARAVEAIAVRSLSALLVVDPMGIRRRVTAPRMEEKRVSGGTPTRSAHASSEGFLRERVSTSWSWTYRFFDTLVLTMESLPACAVVIGV